MIRLSDFAVQNNLDREMFEQFLRKNKREFLDYEPTVLEDDITLLGEGESLDELLEEYKSFMKEENIHLIAEQEKQKKDAELEAALAQILITSGFTFDGYKIVKYSGYISGDDVIQVDRGFGGILGLGLKDVGEALMQSLTRIRRNALRELKQAAYDLGCNAVIGVDFDYITLDPQTANVTGGTTYQPYIFGVTANGNAVIIEKEEL